MQFKNWLNPFGSKTKKSVQRRPAIRLIEAEKLEDRVLLSSTTASTVFNDANANGIFDGGETVETGISVSLFNTGADGVIGGGDDSLVGTRNTNGFGFAFFTNLNAGSYFYQYNLPNGKSATIRDAGTNEALDSDAGIDNRSNVFVLGDTDTEYLVDAGIVDSSVVAATVFNDTNANGIFDGGETVQAGIQVQLWSAGANGAIGGGDDVLVGTKATNAMGFSLFTGLGTGAYFYNFQRPTGKAFTLQDQGPSEAKDSDVGQDGNSSVFILLPASNQYLVDAGLAPAGVSATTGWLDANRDGIFDMGESLFSKASVSLFSTGADGLIGGGDDSLVGTILNQATSIFTDLTFGSYYYTYTLQSSQFFTFQNQGANESKDSDANINGVSNVFTLTPPARTEYLVDFGVVDIPPGTAAATVFSDADGDGIFDPGEMTVDGVSVALYNAGADGVAGGGDDVLVETKLTAGGFAQFSSLIPGVKYFYEYTIPTGMAITLKNQGANDTKDSDVDPNRRSEVFMIEPGGAQFHNDLGLIDGGTVATTVWNDANGNGVFDGGEVTIPGITTQLWWAGNDGVVGGGDDLLLDTVVTNASGFALYKDVSAGDFYYRYVLPSNTTFSPRDQGPNEAKDSDAGTDGNSNVFSLAPNATQFLVDAGMTNGTGVAATTVWDDTNANGIFDEGAVSLQAGITVRLFHAGFDGVIGVDDTLIATVVTNGLGFSQFNNLGTGTYYFVYSTLPAGATFTLQDVPGNEALDSDVDAAGRSNLFFITPGGSEFLIDAGLNIP